MIPISLADILTALDQISEVWRSDTAVERRTDLADLDDLLARLDDMAPQTSAETERIEELCGWIEILMDEIEISLGTEPAPITTEDLDADPSDPRPYSVDARRSGTRCAHASDHTAGSQSSSGAGLGPGTACRADDADD